ncbi:MAG: HAMP domain-containing histidine kinase [Lachnospiraceae bacterium]|nr:HAMP domain-containing histidine kinase [Lachnospiraceae bacterium]
MKERMSIRLKMTLWYSLLICIIVTLTVLAFYFASKSVLRLQSRDYLIAAVEENVDKITYLESRPTEDALSPPGILIPYDKGFLRVDNDFLDVIHDVCAALYERDGVMLYGENPLSYEASSIAFTDSHLWSLTKDGVRFDIYDRKLNLPLPKGKELWIRGFAADTKNLQDLRKIMMNFLPLVPMLLLISLFLGYVMTGFQLAPLRKIEGIAESISKGDDLKKRIELGEGKDELHQLANVFNSMYDRLENSFEAEKRFTSEASHELRTPLAVILAQCSLTLEEERSPREYRDSIRVIRRQAARMNGLVKDILDYARIDQGPLTYPMTECDLSGLAKETVSNMALMTINDIGLKSEIEEGIVMKGNSELLSRLLQNLIINAFKYGKEEGTTLVVLESQEDKVTLTVEDNGIGIPDEEQEKIFERFYRVDSSRSVPGTGLGLSMVMKIIQYHKGSLSLDSKEGKGSRFTIHFPKGKE